MELLYTLICEGQSKLKSMLTKKLTEIKDEKYEESEMIDDIASIIVELNVRLFQSTYFGNGTKREDIIILAFIDLMKGNYNQNNQNDASFYVCVVFPLFNNSESLNTRFSILRLKILMQNVLSPKLQNIDHDKNNKCCYHVFSLKSDLIDNNHNINYNYLDEYIEKECQDELYLNFIDKTKFMCENDTINNEYKEKYHHKLCDENSILLSMRCYNRDFIVFRLHTSTHIGHPIDTIDALFDRNIDGLCQYFEVSDFKTIEGIKKECQEQLKASNINDLYDLNQKHQWKFIPKLH